MKTLLAALMLTSTLVGIADAAPQTKYLLRKGSWATYLVTGTKSGFPICGMRIDGTGMSMHVKYQQNSPPFLQVFKNGWRIPHGLKIQVYLKFDNSKPFPMSATAYDSTTEAGGGSFVEVEIANDEFADFLSMFTEAKKMVIGFYEGTQGPLVADMKGSTEAADMYKRCAASISKEAPQPYATKPAPQPYAVNPTPPAATPTTPFDVTKPAVPRVVPTEKATVPFNQI